MRKAASGAYSVSFFLVLIGCLSLVLMAPLFAQDAKIEPPAGASGPASPPTTPVPSAPQANPAPSAQTVSPAVNSVTQAAVQSGVLVCASRINQVATFLTANAKSAAYLFTAPQHPDQSMFSVSFGVEAKGAPLKYASASFAPTTDGQVGVVYDTVQYVSQSPADVEKSVFKNLKRKGSLGKDIVILDAGTVTVFLMPAGSGCIVIKKEVVR